MLHPRTVETPATEDDKLVAVVRERWSSRYVARELELLQLREVEVICDDQYYINMTLLTVLTCVFL
jgi:hypothetical protein